MGACQMWERAQAGLGAASSSLTITSIRKGHTMDFTDMTDEQLYALIDDANTELGRRQSQATIDAQIAEIVNAARGNVIPDRGKGEPWKPVKGYQDVYFKVDSGTH